MHVPQWLCPKMTEYRRRKLAEFGLNMTVISTGVAMFDGKYWGVLPAVIGLIAFFVLSQEK